MTSNLVFLDLDHTLLHGDAFRRLLFHLYFRLDRINLPHVLAAGLLRKARRITLKRFKEAGMIHFRGWSEPEIMAWGKDFYTSHLGSLVYAQARGVCAQHRAEGHHLVLTTGSPDIYVQAVAGDLGIGTVICTSLEYEAGRFTGRISGSDCLGEAKQGRAHSFAQSMGASMKQAFCYTDHHSDLEFLQSVGHPRAVNPTPQLRRHAEESGWPILDWHA